jgi:hypothetical protein
VRLLVAAGETAAAGAVALNIHGVDRETALLLAEAVAALVERRAVTAAAGVLAAMGSELERAERLALIAQGGSAAGDRARAYELLSAAHNSAGDGDPDLRGHSLCAVARAYADLGDEGAAAAVATDAALIRLNSGRDFDAARGPDTPRPQIQHFSTGSTKDHREYAY